MGNETKWADIAHYYTKSQIDLQIKNRDHAERFLMVSFRNVGGSHFEEWVNDGVYWRAYGSQFSAWADHKPILRHCDDMTDEECFELASLIWGDSDIIPFARSESHRIIKHKAIKFNGKGDPYGDCLFVVGVEGRASSWPIRMNQMTPLAIHYLVSRGFDVFGLIESGQAIRKEVTNVE